MIAIDQFKTVAEIHQHLSTNKDRICILSSDRKRVLKLKQSKNYQVYYYDKYNGSYILYEV